MILNKLLISLKIFQQLLVLVLVFVSFDSWSKATAQAIEKNSAVVSTTITKAGIQTKIKTINARQDVDEATKSKVLSYYKSALDNLSLGEEFNAHSEQFKQALKQVSGQSKDLQAAIEQAQLKQGGQVSEDFTKIPVEELTQRLIMENGKITSFNDQIQKLENQITVQQERPQSIRDESLKISRELESTQKEIEALGNSTPEKTEIAANQTYLKTLIIANNAELDMLENEADSNPARIELLKLELQLLQAKNNALKPVVNAIENVLAEKKQQVEKTMQDALSQAESQLTGKNPAIQEVSRANIQYAQDLQEVNSKIENYSGLKLTIDRQTNNIENEYSSASKKMDLAVLSPPLGKILREQRRDLTDEINFKKQSDTIENETAETNLEQLTIEDKIKQFSYIDQYLNQLMTSKVDTSLPIEKRMMIQAELRVLLNDQKELLSKLSIAYNNYLRTLGDYDFARQQMREKAEKYAMYLDENLLWVKSAEPINAHFLQNLTLSLHRLFLPHNWFGIFNNTIYLPYINPFLSLFALLNLTVLLFYRYRIKQQLIIISEKVSHIHTDNFFLTVKAIIYNLVLVLPLALVIYYWGWFLSSDATIDNFSQAVGTGLQKSSFSLLYVQFFYYMFAADGLMRIHFQWNEQIVRLIRKQIAWLRFIVIPCIFIIFYTETADNYDGDYLGRLALIICLIAIAVFWYRILKPDYGLLQYFINKNPEGWLSKIGNILLLVLVATPLVIAGFAVAGYYSSAIELVQKLIATFRLFFIVIIINELVLRSLNLTNRQLALKNYKQKNKNLAEIEKTAVVPGSIEPMLPLDEDQIDINKINVQTISVLHVFIFFILVISFLIIWRNILPAFSFVENIVLWHYKITNNKQEIVQTITLFNLLLAGLYVFVTYVSVSNFSGVMEMLVFSKSSIEAGSRYAIIQLTNYLLITIGVLAVANELGGSWSELQWLVAALGVGLGFGLQEIFGNLVSGIILLFERPIRVGDTVTIGDVSGKVCRIHMRATTLIDFDQKEVIVPNKAFITSQLVNWTLSDAITRVVFPLGIAYGSDLELAHSLMLKTVLATPLVLTQPEPTVLLTEFGDSSINFTIRIFVAELRNRLPVTHDLHMRLEKALREHNIEIPFPQRDIHVRSIAPEMVMK